MKGRSFNPQVYQQEQERRIQQNNSKKSGGWFSCFSSTAVDSNAPIMMTQAQAERKEQMRQMQDYNQQMNNQQYQDVNGNNDFAPQQKNLQSRQNPMGLRKNTMQATPSDLDTLRSDSKMRL